MTNDERTAAEKRLESMNQEEAKAYIEALPKIAVHWDEATQRVFPMFQPADFRQYSFVVAVLEMAKKELEFAMQQSRAAFLMQQQHQANVAAQVQKMLRNGNGRMP